MDKKSLALLLITTSFASSTFASSTIINKLFPKHNLATSSLKAHKNVKHATHAFTDFSGTWTGTCGDGGVTITTTIENDSDSITFDGLGFRIGQGLESRSDSSNDFTSFDHTSLEWNADGSALTMKSVDVFKIHSDNSTIYVDLTSFTMSKTNDQITLEGKATMLEDATETAQSPMSCVLTKKQ